jgi:hypothetical protein
MHIDYAHLMSSRRKYFEANEVIKNHQTLFPLMNRWNKSIYYSNWNTSNFDPGIYVNKSSGRVIT